MLFNDKQVIGFRVQNIKTTVITPHSKELTLGFIPIPSMEQLSDVQMSAYLKESEDSATVEIEIWFPEDSNDTERIEAFKPIVQNSISKFADLFFEDDYEADVDLLNEVFVINIKSKAGKLLHSIEKIEYFYNDIENLKNTKREKLKEFFLENWYRCPIKLEKTPSFKTNGTYQSNLVKILYENQEASDDDIIDLIKLNMMI